MPIYEYQCTACGHDLEVIQRMSDSLLSDCPACQEPALRKKISAAAFHLKGSGWYKTDFKDMGKKKSVENKEGKSEEKAVTQDNAESAPKPAAGEIKETVVTETKPAIPVPPPSAA